MAARIASFVFPWSFLSKEIPQCSGCFQQLFSVFLSFLGFHLNTKEGRSGDIT